MENNKKIFKFVLGLGNNAMNQISKLCGLYALAGADIFDLSPNIKSLYAAKDGILAAGLNPNDFKYCISIGIKGDKHIKKAYILDKKCNNCSKCITICPQNAILKGNNHPEIDWSKCIGCAKCKNSCIKFKDFKTNLNKVAKEFKNEKIDMVELHISTENEQYIIKNWKYILKNFSCEKSICIDRSKYGDEKLLKLVKKLIKLNPDKTIIQADGTAMSGDTEISSTLQAIAHAQIYKDLPAKIFISGGTNHYTNSLAKSLGIRYDGITMGSFARNSVKDAVENGETSKAIAIAKEIVAYVKNKEETCI